MRTPATQSGFSLVETLVAVTILLIAILGPMAITSQSSQSTSFSSEQVVAFFLAQEGAELIQKARNDLFNQYLLPSGGLNDPWDEFTDTSNGALFEECYESTGCGLEIVGDSNGNLRPPISCNDSADCALNFNPLSGTARSRYTHVSSSLYIDTPYSRVITMENVSAAEVKVVSTVTWRSGNLRDEQSVSVETYLFNTYAY